LLKWNKDEKITVGPFNAIDVEPWPELRQLSAFHKILIQNEFPETSPTPYSPPQKPSKSFKHYITLKLFSSVSEMMKPLWPLFPSFRSQNLSL